jgi:hypothetical protein
MVQESSRGDQKSRENPGPILRPTNRNPKISRHKTKDPRGSTLGPFRVRDRIVWKPAERLCVPLSEPREAPLNHTRSARIPQRGGRSIPALNQASDPIGGHYV